MTTVFTRTTTATGASNQNAPLTSAQVDANFINLNADKAPLTGAGASGTWGISITGTAATATNVAWSGVTSKPAVIAAGATAADARTAIGLGDAATKDTGTAAGTVAAGDDARLSDARTPTGAAGGVLSGTYPNPGFAVDMATQWELDAVAAAKVDKTSLSVMAAANKVPQASGAGKLDPSWLDDISGALPVSRPTLLLDFANSKQVDPRITFTRASTATYYDAQGVLRTAASGVPRIDHDPVTGECSGLLIEEARTNLLTYSEQFDNAAWDKSGTSVSANAVNAPDGALTADKVIETGSGYHLFWQYAAPGATTVTYSVFAKAAENSIIAVDCYNETDGTATIFFNLTSGTKGSVIDAFSGSIYGDMVHVGNGWYRCWITVTTSNVPTRFGFLLGHGQSETLNYTGDGTSGIYIWGAQLEAGVFPTSYIPTSAAATTRAADAASMTGTNFSEWHRQDEGTFVADAQVAATNNYSGTYRHVLQSTQAGSSVSRVGLLVNTLNQMQSEVAVSSVVISSKVQGANTGSVFKVATAYKTNDFAFSANGMVPATDTSGSIPSALSQMFIGSVYGGSANGQLNGTVRRIAFFPKRLANAELQALTA